MSGFRLGYAITNEKMLRSLTTLNQHIITCAPTILQNYVTTYFDEFLEITKPQIADTINKRQRIKRYMEAIGLETMSGNSTFYYMVNIGGFPGGSEEFAKTLLEDHYIAVVPGIAYGPNLDRFVRVGIGSEPIERIEQALFVIRAKANG
jgi:aminotransferase